MSWLRQSHWPGLLQRVLRGQERERAVSGWEAVCSGWVLIQILRFHYLVEVPTPLQVWWAGRVGRRAERCAGSEPNSRVVVQLLDSQALEVDQISLVQHPLISFQPLSSRMSSSHVAFRVHELISAETGNSVASHAGLQSCRRFHSEVQERWETIELDEVVRLVRRSDVPEMFDDRISISRQSSQVLHHLHLLLARLRHQLWPLLLRRTRWTDVLLA